MRTRTSGRMARLLPPTSRPSTGTPAASCVSAMTGPTHRAARALSPRIRPDTNRITPVTLVGLGPPLCVGPLIALTQEAAGVPVDGLLVGGSSLAILPLGQGAQPRE